MRQKIAGLLVLSLAGGAATPAFASGYYLQEQSAKELGRAFAGGAASADDASTIFFNPAGMTELEGNQVSLNAHILFVDSRQRDNGTTVRRTPIGTPTPTGGNDGGNPFDQPVLVPTGYAAFQVSDRLHLGLGVSAPFGLKVVYGDGFFGRYDSTESDVRTINIQPSFAYRLNDNISVGGGIDIQQVDVTLRNALPNIVPGAGDGRLSVRGDDMSLGWNAGVLLKSGAFRLGGHYRSRMKHTLDGSYSVQGLVGPLAAANGRRFATAPLDLPESATLSAMYGAGQRFRVMATGKWFNWSVFDAIEINPLGAAPVISEQNYKDSWSGAIGAEFDVTPRLTLRAGTMYDTTPTRDGFRTTRVPDGDRTWASAGATLRLNQAIDVNLSYAHVFVSREELDRTDSFFVGTPAQSSATIRSTNSGNADVIATSLTMRF